MSKKTVILLATLICLSGAIYGITIFALNDFDPYALQIDACLDSGGRWLSDQNTCQTE